MASLPVGSLEEDHLNIILPRSFPETSIRFVRCALPTHPPGLVFGKVFWAWIQCRCVRHLLLKGFHLLWQVSDHPASVHGIKIERVPTILSI